MTYTSVIFPDRNAYMKRCFSSLICALLFTGCANSSGVFRVSENTYRISTRATWELGGRTGALRMALKQATDFCRAHGGKRLRVIKSSDDYGHFQGGTVDLTFTCE